MLNRILVSYDGSDQSYKAFEFAINLAKASPLFIKEIRVLSVVQPPELADFLKVDNVIDSMIMHFEELFRDLRLRAEHSNIKIITALAVGHPADKIIEYASEHGCDMIIVGQRGHSKIEKWMLGSVSMRVARHALCTVVIVR
jgi:nucleotide-binding universal stress UspA family protein